MPSTRPPAPAPLVDRFGRVHTDLRVSLTDRCNLRCTSVAGKGPGHAINSPEFRRPERPMSAIGG